MNSEKIRIKAKKTLKISIIFLAVLLAVVLLAMLILTVIYPAILRSANKINTPGIDSMETVEIGGIQQAMYFRGQDTGNPVILFIHGGPGNPHMPLLHDFQYELEHYFTIVHWDQRNQGKTLFLNDPETVLETLNFERILDDAYEVTQYIRERLNTDKILVIGNSWGTVIGTALVQTYPEYFSGYIGVGQAVNAYDNERLTYETLLDAVQAEGNAKRIATAEALAPYPPEGNFDETWVFQLQEARMLLHNYIDYGLSNLTFIRILMTSPYYSFREKMSFLSVNTRIHNLSPLLRYLYDEFNVRDFGTTYEVPVFYIMGEYDFYTSYQLAKDFFEEISAPHKVFFTFNDVGHLPMHEDTAEFNRVLIEEIRPLILEFTK